MVGSACVGGAAIGFGLSAVSGVGVGAESFKMAARVSVYYRAIGVLVGSENVQATVRLAAGSVYFVRLGRGLAGKLGVSWCGAGVASSAIVANVLQRYAC